MAKGEAPIQKAGHTKGEQIEMGADKAQDGELFTHKGVKQALGKDMKKYGRNLARAKNQGGK